MSPSPPSRRPGSPPRTSVPFWHVRIVFAPVLSAALLGVTYLYWHHAEKVQETRRQQNFEAAAERLVSGLRGRMGSYEMVLRGLKGYVDSSEVIEPGEFSTYVTALQLDKTRPGLQALCLLELVPHENLRLHVQAMRAQGLDRYEVRSRGDRGAYALVTRVEPRTRGNLSALGFDTGSLPAAREAMDRARDTGAMALSGLWSVAQDEDPGVMMFLPVYRGGGTPATLEGRREAIHGWVAAPFRVAVVASALMRELDPALSLRIQDGPAPGAGEAAELYDSREGDAPAPAGRAEPLRAVRVLDVGGRPWTLTMEPLPVFDQRLGRDNHVLIACLGALFSILAGWFIALQATGHQRALALARSMTSELRTVRDNLEGILQAVPDVLFELDLAGRIHYHRSALADLSSEPSRAFEGRLLAEVLPAPVASEFLQALREAEAQGVSLGRQFHQDTPAGPRWFELSVARRPSDPAGGPGATAAPPHYVALARDITSRRETEAAMHQLAYYDALTGLPNRRLLFDQLQAALDHARRDGRTGALFFIDLDNFKQLNDARGHAAGDRLLVQVARRLERLLQGFGSVVRIGGDEFVVLIPRIANGIQAGVDAAGAMAARLREGMETPYDLGSNIHYSVTASTGVTLFPKGGESVDDLLREADTAMYRAKSSGANRVCFFEADMQAAAQERLALEQDLAQAIAEDALDIHIHSQVDRDGSICGGELLLRWQHPAHGSVSPARFVAIAEDSGLIVRLGARVIRRACDALARLHAAGLDRTISVNVSARQFRQDDFVGCVRDALAYSGAPASRLILEVTETLLVENWQDTARRMAELVRFGVRFSIDDFGTGYSSLAYLKRLPLYELKIDRSFVQDAPDHPNDAAIVRAILSMAQHLRLRVVAEGVETAAQAEFLAQHGCDAMQGYLYAQPVPLQEWIAAQTGGAEVA